MKEHSDLLFHEDNAGSSWESLILRLGDDTVLVECGPMRLLIEASDSRRMKRPDVCIVAARKAIKLLEEVAVCLPFLKKSASTSDDPKDNPLAHAMWTSVRKVQAPDLTPMAAVAGAIADGTADCLTQLGMTRVTVNNGGDVAIRVQPEESVSVGVRLGAISQGVSYRLIVSHGSGIGGVCTSGLGGRSFSRGVAEAVTVLAATSALADAAATAVANATLVKSSSVERIRAELLDPDSDLVGLEITRAVGLMTQEEKARALRQGIQCAEDLVNREVVIGACVSVQGHTCMTEKFRKLVFHV